MPKKKTPSPKKTPPPKKEKESLWKGSVFFIDSARIVFVGEAGTSVNQAIHAIKICIALDGDFELITDARAKGERHSAVIINAGITHTVKCNGSYAFDKGSYAFDKPRAET